MNTMEFIGLAIYLIYEGFIDEGLVVFKRTGESGDNSHEEIKYLHNGKDKKWEQAF